MIAREMQPLSLSAVGDELMLYTVLGEFETQLNHLQAAIANFRRALGLSELSAEQAFLSKPLEQIQQSSLQNVA
jgi:predicted RNA polymerase sigma factor